MIIELRCASSVEQACEARATAVNGGETTVYEEADRRGAAEGVLEKDFGLSFGWNAFLNFENLLHR